MKQTFSNLFDKLFFYHHWFLHKGRFAPTRIGDAFYIIIGIMILLYTFIGDNEFFIEKFAGIFGVLIFFTLFLITFKSYWIKPPKFIRKSNDEVSGFLSMFSHSSYLYGLTIFTFFLTFTMSGLMMVASQFIIGVNFDWQVIFYNLLFLSMSLFTVLYFMYHISKDKITIKQAKARISFYLLCSGCITAGLFGSSFRVAVTPFLTYVGIGYLCLRYLIDKIDSES
ncbi:hypothetical protein [Paenibacillus pseudetheri]|uniref:ABC transporter permease n=1 Tax=Paenibacillus pseudetheri TaxID=2897682 RepID=A0ABM9BAR0_9BACL|nr:hypothetical protein [Paenibacillus pseudetheri]CAH1055808.1 hypothetical protein PAECIP111894_01960 [Paenibacillus pseudetheri]